MRNFCGASLSLGALNTFLFGSLINPALTKVIHGTMEKRAKGKKGERGKLGGKLAVVSGRGTVT